MSSVGRSAVGRVVRWQDKAGDLSRVALRPRPKGRGRGGHGDGGKESYLTVAMQADRQSGEWPGDQGMAGELVREAG